MIALYYLITAAAAYVEMAVRINDKMNILF
jgi:hypothetical protein